MAKAGKEKDVEKMLEEENAKFTEAIQDEGKGGQDTKKEGRVKESLKYCHSYKMVRPAQVEKN
ncbi:hypothetical protein QTG54_013634 [Skeletonema marinoi]|uniref:Uncharacterized protein n=1 Tax=Skeletonema marinoi TaxID=267567 RepID=A0AAD8XX04_9STRA|nr:hypothetical protein QTG54_013634 [Skeletonema marinoi]